MTIMPQKNEQVELKWSSLQLKCNYILKFYLMNFRGQTMNWVEAFFFFNKISFSSDIIIFRNPFANWIGHVHFASFTFSLFILFVFGAVHFMYKLSRTKFRYLSIFLYFGSAAHWWAAISSALVPTARIIIEIEYLLLAYQFRMV